MKDGGKARNTIFCNFPHGPIRVWHLSSSSPLTCCLDLLFSLSLSLSLLLSLLTLPSQLHASEKTAPRFPHELMIALSMMDFTERQREFDAHADLGADGDGTEGAGRRMGKRGLAGLMRAHGLAHGDAEVERVLARIDANGNGEIDFGEFCALARANSDLEQAVRAKRPDCVLAAFFPTGTALEDLGTMR